MIYPDGTQASWNVYYKIWLQDRLEEGQLPGNILEKFESRHSSAELKALEIPFDFAKPSALIKFLMTTCGVKEGDITLDFFAGSCSTAHAAMELSSETGQNRPFICVQLPEKTAENSEEFKQGFETISDIGKERIRRAAAQIREKNPIFSGVGDLGFRVYKLDSSCFKQWDGQIADIAERQLVLKLESHANHVDGNAKAEDILCELLLKDGFTLTVPIEQLSLETKKVFSVAEGALLICLELQLTQEVMDAMAALDPARVIVLDAGFQNNDQLKANAVQTFKARARDKESAIVLQTV